MSEEGAKRNSIFTQGKETEKDKEIKFEVVKKVDFNCEYGVYVGEVMVYIPCESENNEILGKVYTSPVNFMGDTLDSFWGVATVDADNNKARRRSMYEKFEKYNDAVKWVNEKGRDLGVELSLILNKNKKKINSKYFEKVVVRV